MGHTKGEWQDCGMNDEGLNTIKTQNNIFIAYCYFNNAQLIASAPDLLEACKMAIESIKWMSRHTQATDSGAIELLQQAISKAKGE
jgi:hypothetical protein